MTAGGEAVFDSLEQALANTPAGSKSGVRLHYDAGNGKTHRLVCSVLRGAGEGPTLWVQGGVHGDEYDGPVAAWELSGRLNPQKLSGRLIIVPVANPTAFEAGRNASPEDDVNLNRVFPGRRDGSFSHRYGAWLFDLMCRHADCVVDLHGGGKYLDVCRFAMVAETGGKADGLSLELARSCGADYIYANPSREGGMLYSALSREGIPAVLLENGGGLTWSREATDRHISGVKAMMARLGMLPGGSRGPSSGKVIRKLTELRFARGGLQTDRVNVGAQVAVHDPLIEVMDVYSLAREQLLCPVSKGVVLSIHTAALARPGDYAVMIGEL